MTEDELKQRVGIKYCKTQKTLKFYDDDDILMCGFRNVEQPDVPILSQVFMRGVAEGYSLSITDIEAINDNLNIYNISGIRTK